MTATDMQSRSPHAHKLQSHKAQTRSRTAKPSVKDLDLGLGCDWGGGTVRRYSGGKLKKLCREILSMPHQ